MLIVAGLDLHTRYECYMEMLLDEYPPQPPPVPTINAKAPLLPSFPCLFSLFKFSVADSLCLTGHARQTAHLLSLLLYNVEYGPTRYRPFGKGQSIPPRGLGK